MTWLASLGSCVQADGVAKSAKATANPSLRSNAIATCYRYAGKGKMLRTQEINSGQGVPALLAIPGPNLNPRDQLQGFVILELGATGGLVDFSQYGFPY